MEGKTHDEAREVIHPETGLPGKSAKLTAYTLNCWLENRSTLRTISHRFEESSTEDDDWEPPSDAERARVMALLDKTKKALQRATSAHRATKRGAEVSEPLEPVSTLSAAQNEAIEKYIRGE